MFIIVAGLFTVSRTAFSMAGCPGADGGQSSPRRPGQEPPSAGCDQPKHLEDWEIFIFINISHYIKCYILYSGVLYHFTVSVSELSKSGWPEEMFYRVL